MRSVGGVGRLDQSDMDKRAKEKTARALKHPLMPPPPYCRKGDKTGSDAARQPLSQVKVEVSDAGELLQLCEKLNDCSTAALEAKINKYVSSF